MNQTLMEYSLPAIGLIRFPQARTIFLGYGIENFTKLANFIDSVMTLSPEPGIVIISDLGLSDDERVIDICNRTFAKTKASKWQVRWVDHHPWSKKALESLKPFIDIVLDESGKKCAADLMYETFLRGNEIAATLARLAHTMDFFTNDQYLTPTSDLSITIGLFRISTAG